MRFRVFALVSSFILGCALAFGQTGFTTVSSASLGGATSLISNATIYWEPMNGSPGSLAAARISTTGGQIANPPYEAEVTSGAFSLLMPDAFTTTPTICYAVTVIDNSTGNILLGSGLDSNGHVSTGGAYGCVQPTGSTWSFDSYIPTGASVQTQIIGPPGPATSIEIGSVTTGSPGSSASASMSGSSPLQTLDLTIPMGATGPAGGSLSYPGVASDGLNGLTLTGGITAAHGIASIDPTAPPYSMVGDGSTNNLAALNLLITNQQNGTAPGHVTWPAGTFYFNGCPEQVPFANGTWSQYSMHWSGAGRAIGAYGGVTGGGTILQFNCNPAALPSTATITGGSVSGGTLTFTGTDSFYVGEQVTISGNPTSCANASMILTAATSASFSAQISGCSTAPGAGGIAVPNGASGILQSFGAGVWDIDNLSIVNTNVSASAPMFVTSRTVVHIEKTDWEAASGSNEPGVQLGSNNAADGIQQFFGYGSYVRTSFFTQCGTCIASLNYANATEISGNHIYGNFVPAGPFFNGPGISINGGAGVTAFDNWIETPQYLYGIQIQNTRNTISELNSCWDSDGSTASAACQRVENTATNTQVSCGFTQDIPCVSDNGFNTNTEDPNAVLPSPNYDAAAALANSVENPFSLSRKLLVGPWDVNFPTGTATYYNVTTDSTAPITGAYFTPTTAATTNGTGGTPTSGWYAATLDGNFGGFAIGTRIPATKVRFWVGIKTSATSTETLTVYTCNTPTNCGAGGTAIATSAQAVGTSWGPIYVDADLTGLTGSVEIVGTNSGSNVENVAYIMAQPYTPEPLYKQAAAPTNASSLLEQFLFNGNATTPYNASGLLILPNDADSTFTTTNFPITADTTAPVSGAYFSTGSGAGWQLSTLDGSLAGITVGQGQRVPATKVRFYLLMKNSATANSSFAVYPCTTSSCYLGGHGSQIATSATVSVGTTYTLLTLDADLTSYSGQSVEIYGSNSTSVNTEVAWIAMRPWSSETLSMNPVLPQAVGGATLTGQTAAIGATSFYTNSSGAPMAVRITIAGRITTAGTGTSWQVQGGVSGDAGICSGAAPSVAGTTIDNGSSCSFTTVLMNGESAFYTVAYTGVTSNPTYDLDATVERLQ